MQERARHSALCAEQRDDLAAAVRQLNCPLNVADKGLAGARYLHDHAWLLGVGAAAMAVTRGRGPWKRAQRGCMAWRAYRAFGKSGAKSLW
ncbi:MAG: YqjK family protein [Burkholderiales bacterium]